MKESFISSPAAYPQGEPWNSNISGLPGVQGNIANYGNHYKFKDGLTVPVPESSRNMLGGKSKRKSKKKYKRKTRNKRKTHHKNKNKRKTHNNKRKKYNKKSKTFKGGSGRNTFLPESLVNFGRGIMFGATDLVNTWNGVTPTPSYSPVDQPIFKSSIGNIHNVVDVPSINLNANKTVGNM